MKVMVTGKFNPLHPGHILFLEKAKKLGDYLIVVVANDKTILKQDGCVLLKDMERKKIVESLRIVNKAVIGNPGEDHFRIVEKIKPDILALGYDQEVDEEMIRKRARNAGLKLKVMRIKDRVEGIKSTTIRNRIAAYNKK
ncbi:MAG: adenylyltransferase/cytidyltransferase family protein [Candidatus Aenigmatarchaeota archaeon]